MSDGQSGTRVIELTPPGRGAVAVLLVAGPDAVRLVDACFRPLSGRPFRDAAVDRIVVGRWRGQEGEELVARRRDDDAVEIHCHGGIAAVGNVSDRLCELGGTRLPWRDWVRETEANPLSADARVALADAPSERTAAILIDQLQGALASAIRRILAATGTGDWPAAARTIDELLSYRDVGLHLTTPWRVVLAGRPNVGKSSLFNALAGYQRAIVCDRPGTTRDVVTVNTAIDGWPVELADTAGLRKTKDELESAGVARASAALAAADLVVMVCDATESQEGDWDVPLPRGRAVHVLNKIDLLPQPVRRATGSLWTSALTGQGIAELVAAIGRALVPEAPPAGAAVPFTAEHVSRLETARRAVQRHDAAAVSAGLRVLLAS